MKKYHLFLLWVFICLTAQAQKPKNQCSEEEFHAKKQAFMTEQAELTETEAAQFFPIYFELQALKKESNRKAWKQGKEGKNPDTTEEQYGNILQGFIEAEERNCELDKEYLKKYQTILSNKKIYKILQAEIKFNRHMLKIMQEGKKGKP